MRLTRLAAIIAIACCTLAASAQVTYENTRAKANRFFDNSEWASAAAVYGLMLHERPSIPDTYGRAIVSYEMLDEEGRAMELLNSAMNHGVSLDSVLTNVQKHSYAIGQGPLYEQFINQAYAAHPWMQRPLDAYLLRYYTERRNGPMMVKVAQRMLQGSPDNINFMATEADGEMISGNTANAVEIWKKILAIAPDNYLAILQLANYYDLNGQGAEALPYFRRAKAIRATPYVDDRIRAIDEAINKK